MELLSYLLGGAVLFGFVALLNNGAAKMERACAREGQRSLRRLVE